MKVIGFVLCIVCIPFLYGQELKPSDKRRAKSLLREKQKLDQQYRTLITRDSKDEDSLWVLQLRNDSINKESLVQLIGNYGYPSQERVGLPTTVFLTLHLTLERDFNDLQSLFERERIEDRMPVLEYARWYDRCLINMNQKNQYGVYGQKEFCGDELMRINTKRRSINLEPLMKGPDCK